MVLLVLRKYRNSVLVWGGKVERQCNDESLVFLINLLLLLCISSIART